MEQLTWVCLGSALGGGARYLVSGWALRLWGAEFPYGTLTVNMLGSFLLSVLMFAGLDTSTLSPTLRLALTTGAMGGFTTYSTFSYESMRYLQEGAVSTALINIFVTVLGCLAASLLGWVVARSVLMG